MPRLAFALLVLLLAPPPSAAQDPSASSSSDPMAGWSPPVVKQEKKDRQEIEAFLKKMEATSEKGDLEGAAALVDFPVLMVTDDKKGEAGGGMWSREQWVATMKPMYEKPMPPGAMKPGKRTIVLLSDSLALVGSGWTMTMGPKKVTGTSGLVLIRVGGEWKAKSFIEGGWGDVALPDAGQGAAPPAK